MQQSRRNLPEGVDVSGSGKGKLALAVTWAHFANDLWRQITDPAVRELQLVLPPVREGRGAVVKKRRSRTSLLAHKEPDLDLELSSY